MNTCLKTGFVVRINGTDHAADLHADQFDLVTVVFNENPDRASNLSPEMTITTDKKIASFPCRHAGNTLYRVSTEPFTITPDFRKTLISINPERRRLILGMRIAL